MIKSELRILGLLLAFLFFVGLPLNPYAPSLFRSALPAYLLLPALTLLLAGRNPLSFGLGPGEWKKGLLLTLLLSVLILVGCFVLSLASSMQFFYSPPRWGTGDARIIAMAEWKRLIQVTGWEFLFRGFLLFSLHSLLGPAANGIQATLCAIMHIHKPTLEFLGSFPFALVLGWLALRTRSIWYGVFLHCLLGFALEAFVALGKQGFL